MKALSPWVEAALTGPGSIESSSPWVEAALAWQGNIHLWETGGASHASIAMSNAEAGTIGTFLMVRFPPVPSESLLALETIVVMAGVGVLGRGHGKKSNQGRGGESREPMTMGSGMLFSAALVPAKTFRYEILGVLMTV